MNEQHKQTCREALEYMLRAVRMQYVWTDKQLIVPNDKQQRLAAAQLAIDKCVAALAALDEPEWTPLEDGAYQADHDGDSFILFNGFLNVEETDIVTGEKRNAEIALPPEYAICRRTSPAVPTEARTQEVTGED